MNRQVIFTWIILSFLIVLFAGCSSNNLKNQISDFMSIPIHIPYDKLDKHYCSMFSDSTESHKSIKMVYYVDSLSCTPCEINKMTLIDAKKRDLYPDVEFIFIINISRAYVDAVCSSLYNSRIQSPVYLDTLNCFLPANPHIAESNLFHHFVMNDKDSVLMVGLPFSTNEMENLFIEILKNNKSAKQ